MKHELSPHPSLAGYPPVRITAEVTRPSSGLLRLRYMLAGELDALRIPSTADMARTDGLWRHTCFEAFIHAGGGAYYELNVAPSTEWASYRFSGYRDGMSEAEIEPKRIEVVRTDWSWFKRPKRGRLRLTLILPLPADATGPFGLSAVVEAADGRHSYWALAHPPGAPDFHHPDCFTAELPPPPRP